MGHTNRTLFTSTSDWEPVANLTQVFSGSVLNNFPDPGQWMEITLDTAFTYNNSTVGNFYIPLHAYAWEEPFIARPDTVLLAGSFLYIALQVLS